MFLCSLRYCLKCYFSKGVYSLTLSTVCCIYALPVAARIQFKALMLAYRTTTGSPTYFHSLLRIYIPSRSLRSASKRRLVVPSQRGSKSLSRTFSFTIPGWWNDLPNPIRNAGSLSIFKQQLKIHLFQLYLKVVCGSRWVLSLWLFYMQASVS